MMHAAYNMARAIALAIACLSHGCGPVGTPAPDSPIKATARRAVAAALRAALAEACRATLPPRGRSSSACRRPRGGLRTQPNAGGGGISPSAPAAGFAF